MLTNYILVFIILINGINLGAGITLNCGSDIGQISNEYNLDTSTALSSHTTISIHGMSQEESISGIGENHIRSVARSWISDKIEVIGEIRQSQSVFLNSKGAISSKSSFVAGKECFINYNAESNENIFSISGYFVGEQDVMNINLISMANNDHAQINGNINYNGMYIFNTGDV